VREIPYDQSDAIPRLIDLVASLSTATTPQQVLGRYSRYDDELGRRDGFLSVSTAGLRPGEYRITRMVFGNVSDTMSTADPWSTPDLPVRRGGFLGDVIAGGRPRLFTAAELRDDPVLGDALADYRSIMAMPLYHDGQPRYWAVAVAHRPDAFSPETLESVLLRANLVGQTVTHVRLADELRTTQAALQAEVARIADIQRALLDDALPDLPGYSLAAHYETAASAGGDMYFFHPLGTSPLDGTGEPNGWWSVFIADVSGHGPAAAVVMAMVQSILAAYPATTSGGPAQILNYLNRHLAAKQIDGAFVTAFCAELKPADGRLTYARAGHPPPLVRARSADGRPVRCLDAVGGLPLGIVDDTEYTCTQTRLDPGDALLLFTDGIPEARSTTGDFFGNDALADALLACPGSTAQDVIDSVVQAVDRHTRPLPRDDDQTLVAIVRQPDPEAT
jgi:sigma-B regulation protein RsbU (phosphoserine phosphatase)